MPTPKQRKATVEEAEEDRFENIDVSIVRNGEQIILPNQPFPMSLPEAIKVMERAQAQDETTVNLHLPVDAYPLDGAYAFMKAMQRTYGWASAEPTLSFFGPQPPTMLSLEIAPDKSIPVIWGAFQVPNIEGRLRTMADTKNGRFIFVLAATVKRKHEQAVAKLAELTRQIVREESVYRGSAIELYANEEGALDPNRPPTFMNLNDVDEEQIIFNRPTEVQIRTNVFVPIEKTARCREERIPLKRTCLMTGTYGTGKTLTAKVTAKKCVEHGWTFIMTPVDCLSDALRFARLYQPAVVFAEDVDQVVSGERDGSMNEVLNTIDGIDQKSCEIMTILTTNHVEGINPAMLRPGRLDAIIHVDLPDEEASQRLIRLYGGSLIPAEHNLDEAGEALKGQIPASIREAVERAKLFAISRLTADEEISICGSDIAAAAQGMQAHLSLLNKPQEKPHIDSISESIRSALEPAIERIVEDKVGGLKKSLETVIDME